MRTCAKKKNTRAKNYAGELIKHGAHDLLQHYMERNEVTEIINDSFILLGPKLTPDDSLTGPFPFGIH